MRFALQVAAAVVERIGSERTGIRLSPGSQLGGIDEGADIANLYRHLVAGLAEFNLAYLHLSHAGDDGLLRDIRQLWPNALLVNRGNRPLEALGSDIEAGLADMAPVARWALANPDFIERIRHHTPLNELDPTTLYGGGASGYTDYPMLGESVHQRA